MSTVFISVGLKHNADPYTAARDAIALSKRLGVTVVLQITHFYSCDVGPDDIEGMLASNIMHGRNSSQTVPPATR